MTKNSSPLRCRQLVSGDTDHGYKNGWQLQQGIAEYMEFYNYERPHQSLDYKTPMSQYAIVA
jgi:transposase InsO family protein